MVIDHHLEIVRRRELYFMSLCLLDKSQYEPYLARFRHIASNINTE